MPGARCAWDGHRSGEGISTFFRRLFPFFFKRVARIATKPLIRTVARGAKTIGKKAIKSASKHGLKKLAKEVAKEGATEIAKLGAEKVLQGIDSISTKAKQKGAPASKIDAVTAAIKKGVKNVSADLSSSAAKKIDSSIDKLIPVAGSSSSASKKKRKRKPPAKKSSGVAKAKKARKSLANLIEEACR